MARVCVLVTAGARVELSILYFRIMILKYKKKCAQCMSHFYLPLICIITVNMILKIFFHDSVFSNYQTQKYAKSMAQKFKVSFLICFQNMPLVFAVVKMMVIIIWGYFTWARMGWMVSLAQGKEEHRRCEGD